MILQFIIITGIKAIRQKDKSKPGLSYYSIPTIALVTDAIN
jgi:hypothetical protein